MALYVEQVSRTTREQYLCQEFRCIATHKFEFYEYFWRITSQNTYLKEGSLPSSLNPCIYSNANETHVVEIALAKLSL